MTVRYEKGAKDTRPWGTWEVVDAGETYVVKRIVVDAGQKLSLQSHDHRNEHWVVARGTAEITLGEKVFAAPADTAVFIPVKTKHRVRNPGTEPLVFIEVQTGETLDENDITRYEDDYGRV